MAKGPGRKSRAGGNRQARNPRPMRTTTLAGPVTVTKADGTMEVHPPLRGRKLKAVSKKSMPKEWAVMRAQHLRVYPECRACGYGGEVVHHLRYRGKRGVNERPGDLVTLCRSCHDDLHRVYNQEKKRPEPRRLDQFSLDYMAEISAAISASRP